MDVFLVKFNKAGVKQWATYYGGSGDDEATSVVVDGAENVYVAGVTTSSVSIASAGAHQTTYNGSADAFLVKFNKSGALRWATYYGGTADDLGSAVAVDASGHVFMAGYTGSTTTIATSGTFQTAYGGGTEDAFLV